MTEPRLYGLTVITTPDREIKCCQTLALDLDSAIQQATDYYGPLELNAHGSRSLPEPDRVLIGGGTYIPSAHDHLLPPHQLKQFIS
jgi:hypothetical protein